MGAAEREGPVQGRLYRSMKLWTFYCDLEESLGTQESTRAAYDRIMDLRIATPQIILNYAAFLQVRQGLQLFSASNTGLYHIHMSGVYSCTFKGVLQKEKKIVPFGASCAFILHPEHTLLGLPNLPAR